MCAVVNKASYGGLWYSRPAEPKKAGKVNGIIWWLAATSDGLSF